MKILQMLLKKAVFKTKKLSVVKKILKLIILLVITMKM